MPNNNTRRAKLFNTLLFNTLVYPPRKSKCKEILHFCKVDKKSGRLYHPKIKPDRRITPCGTRQDDQEVQKKNEWSKIRKDFKIQFKPYKRQRTHSINGLRPSISFSQMRDELQCKDTNIIWTSIKIFRNFNIKKNFCISCIFSTLFSNIYTFKEISAVYLTGSALIQYIQPPSP